MADNLSDRSRTIFQGSGPQENSPGRPRGSGSGGDMRYEILGPLRVVADHRDIPITAGRERALLAMLLLRANQVVPVSQLVEVLWAARTPRDVRGQLHGCVSRLRRRLGEAGGQA